MEYVFFRAGTQPNGGFYLVKKMPRKGQVNIYIEVEDIEMKLKEIRKARGKVMVGKTEVGGLGWIAQFSTPDGCFLSLWQSKPKEVESGEPLPQF
jgi:predicted enzyme related to lactoylglutathione lyase